MTQEEKSLLMVDLSGRLPYRTICNELRHGDSTITEVDIVGETVYCDDFDEYSKIKHIKPYLRPLYSMTEEEAREIGALHDIKDILSVKVTDEYIVYIVDDGVCSTETKTIWYDEIISSIVIFDYLNAHHFDYRGLIEKGIAIEAIKENNPYKD